jgi:large subunit ribosomal protein L20
MRSTKAVARRAAKKRVLKLAKGFFLKRKNCWKIALRAINRKLRYQYIHRRLIKRTMRSTWIVRINAFARQYGYSYSRFMAKIKENNITFNRKTISELAISNPGELAKICGIL